LIHFLIRKDSEVGNRYIFTSLKGDDRQEKIHTLIIVKSIKSSLRLEFKKFILKEILKEALEGFYKVFLQGPYGLKD